MLKFAGFEFGCWVCLKQLINTRRLETLTVRLGGNSGDQMSLLSDRRRNLLKSVSCEVGVCRNSPPWRVGGADLGYGGVLLANQGKGGPFLCV